MYILYTFSDFSTTLTSPSMLMCSGGYKDEALSSCEMYDLHSDRWSNISPLNFARDGPGVVSLNNSIYASGGSFTRYLGNLTCYLVMGGIQCSVSTISGNNSSGARNI